MAAAELSRTEGSHRPLAGLGRAWLAAYAAIWLTTLGSGLFVAASGASAKATVRQVLDLCLSPTCSTPRQGALALAAHNLPVEGWPLLLGVAGVHRARVSRRIANAALCAAVLVNVLPVGAALGAYGSPLLPYLPQLPLEWAGLALGASAWLLQRQKPLTVSEGLALAVLIAALVMGAGIAETSGVPRR
jgi:hypothetical protein